MDKHMKKYELLYKLIVGFTVLTTLFALLICGGYVYRYVKCRLDFKAKKYDTYYGQNVPLHEANLQLYNSLFFTSGLAHNIPQEFELTCDIHYYASKYDRKPVYTIKKGTIVKVSDYIGKGYVCWPDYDKEWRYGSPFDILDENQNIISPDDVTKQKYYVKNTELQKAAEAYYRQQVIPYYGWRILFLVHDYNEIHAIRPAYQARKMTQRIDSTLYHNGCFCAPQYDTYEP